MTQCIGQKITIPQGVAVQQVLNFFNPPKPNIQ